MGPELVFSAPLPLEIPRLSVSISVMLLVMLSTKTSEIPPMTRSWARIASLLEHQPGTQMLMNSAPEPHGMTGFTTLFPTLTWMERRLQSSESETRNHTVTTTVMLPVSFMTSSKLRGARCSDSPPRMVTTTFPPRPRGMENSSDRCSTKTTSTTRVRTVPRHGLSSSRVKDSCKQYYSLI